MRHGLRTAVALASGALLAVGAAAPADAAGGESHVAVQAASPAATPAARVSATPATTTIDFSVGLRLSDPAGAAALARAVSDPASPSYRHYLTAGQWEQRFSPSQASVAAVTAWLTSAGATIVATSPDRMTVQASAPAASVEKAFGVSLGQYATNGRVVRLSSGPLTAPASVAPLISGVVGVDEVTRRPSALTGNEPASRRARGPAPAAVKEEEGPIPQPEGFRNAPPCSHYYGQRSDTTDPPYGGGYPSPLPYAPCGYVPAQYQSAYGLAPYIGSGVTGRGVTVAIIDAYASPTLLSDAETYSKKNQPSAPLSSSQFSEILSKKFNDISLCEAPGWFGEQTLDVEAVHATAPGAHILYAGAKNCVEGLYESMQRIVDHHLANVISDSWGDNAGDLLDSAGEREFADNIFMMAAGTGISVLFSSGDNGDEFAFYGFTAPDFPPSSPWVTAVGGTSLQVGSAGQRSGETGWSTSKSVLCTSTLEAIEYPGCSAKTLSTWLPPAPGAYDYGGGGGTSYHYELPWYQQGVVPAPLAERNTAITKVTNRVEPDISMDGDPSTGMLVGETQTFPNGVYYDQYRIGGTSLSSPLFAGVMALADQAAGKPLGFVNPALYKLAAYPSTAAGAYYDVLAAGKQALVRNDYLNGVSAGEGILTSVRTLGYEGKEEFCSGTGNCTRQKVALKAFKGFDSMTGIGTPSAGLVEELAAG